MTARFDNRVILVTGATGIAGAAAEHLTREGASVFTVSRTEEHCRDLHERLEAAGATHAFTAADLRDEASTVDAFAACIDRFGRIDGLLTVAGGSGRRFGDGMVHTVSLDAWHATLDLNLTTTFLSVREAIAHMLDRGGGGSIAVVTSVLAEHPSPELFGTHAYAVSKGGQVALVRAAAAAYAAEGIRVNAIAPSVVLTPMSERAQDDDAITTYVRRKQPLSHGFLTPGTVASAAAYLLSSESDAVTGQVLAVDGGWSVTEVRT